MNNEQKAQEIAKSYPMPPSSITTSDAVAMIENGALQMAEWKDKQTAEALHKACIAIMEDIGSKLGRIQLKATVVLNSIPDEYVSEKMEGIIDAASDINKFAGTLEDYLRSQLVKSPVITQPALVI